MQGSFLFLRMYLSSTTNWCIIIIQVNWQIQWPLPSHLPTSSLLELAIANHSPLLEYLLSDCRTKALLTLGLTLSS